MTILSHMRQRRLALQRELQVWQEFKKWEETCVPSYCHPNLLAAYVSWARLFAASEVAARVGAKGPVLDFGASTGELARLLPRDWPYHFVEQDDAPARYLMNNIPNVVRHTLESAPGRSYGCVFALDALEHNENFPELIARLSEKLAPGGVFVLSGPTENAIYKLGRRIAGFDSHYHVSNIDAIEAAMAKVLVPMTRRRLPFGLPLFKISAWSRPA
jgi:2-polyprenyl-3-methyl-5-hydroxy-6-metoxy-1,4-benzoquinol methylase